MSYEVFSQKPAEELPKKELESQKLKGAVKTINIVLYIVGLLLILFNFIGPILMPYVSFARTSFDYYEEDTYVYSMYEDDTNYIFYLEIDGNDYFDLYDKESGNITHNIITLALGSEYDGSSNVQRYMYDNGYSVISNFYISTFWYIPLPLGIIIILLAFINHRNNVDSGVRKFKHDMHERRLKNTKY